MSPRGEDKSTRNSIARRKFVKFAGAAGVAGIAGCTGGGDTDGNTNGTSSGDDSSAEVTKVQLAVYSAAPKEKKEQVNDILHDAGLPEDIELEPIGGSWTTNAIREQYNQWLSSGRSKPDLMMMDSGWTAPFIARDQVANLSDVAPDIVETIQDSYFDASVSSSVGSNGNQYGIPLFPAFPVMQYRKDLVEEAGYDPEGESWATESMSWKRFGDITKDVKEQSGTKYGFTTQAADYEGLSCCIFNEFITGWGGAYFGSHDNLFGPVGDRPITVTEQPVIDSIKMFRTFLHGQDDEHSLEGYAGNIAPIENLQWKEETSREPFANGDAVMHRNWPYSLAENGVEEKLGDDLGVMPIPYGVPSGEGNYEGTGGPVAALGGFNVTMNPNSEDKEPAKAVLRALTQESVQLAFFETFGWLPPRRELLTSDKASEIPVIGRYTDQLKRAGENAVSRPVTVVWPDESARISSEVNGTYNQEKSPEQAMADLEEDLSSIENSI